MLFPTQYKALPKSTFSENEYMISPVRREDRYEIMKWRNDQINVLRQENALSEAQQDDYFENILSRSFNDPTPDQLIFSFFKSYQLIGYGGLTHIDWKNRNSEISFLLKTDLNRPDVYSDLFEAFLGLICQVGKISNLHKIYTYGYNLSEYRFKPLIKSDFIQEACLMNHKSIDGKLYDVLIYSKIL